MQLGGGVEEELLAISPPPEFQDPSAPPPATFRDLSPSPAGAGGTTSHNRKDLQLLFDFADRISFDILNEAMVIATEELILVVQRGHSVHGGGCNRSTAPIHGSSSYEELAFSPDSSDSEHNSNPLSTTTSWEFISKASSWSDLRCLQSDQKIQTPHNHTSPRHQVNNIISKPHSSRSSVSFHNEISGSSYLQEQSCRSSLTRSISCKDPPKQSSSNPQKVNHDILSTHTQFSNVAGGKYSDRESLNYNNVPMQCDIYSLPIDSIVTSNSSNCPVAAPRRSRVRDSVQSNSAARRVQIDSESRQKLQKKSQISYENSLIPKPYITSTSATNPQHSRLLKNLSESETPLNEMQNTKLKQPTEASTKKVKCERNNNLASEASGSVNISSNSLIKKPARRSRSVEINNISVNYFSSDDQQNNSSPLERIDIPHDKPEKRRLGHSILNLFKRNKPRNRYEHLLTSSLSIPSEVENLTNETKENTNSGNNVTRALPPTPMEANDVPNISSEVPTPDNTLISPFSDGDASDVSAGGIDFAASIEKVKDCGWYWGPLSSETAEDLLRGEPDGSFIVRDSSDAHYIFSLTFKLNGLVRHVRIEHDQGNFSFGPLTRFKAATIVDFVEKAVAHSRSGRYLFFLHRRPVLGPMRVQLLHPYSRFRHPRSLQHMCRFVILKYVRRDLIHTLPLPKPLQDYLNTPHYYFEQLDEKRKEF